MSIMRSESAQSLNRAPSAASIRNPMLSAYGDKEMDPEEYGNSVSQGMRNQMQNSSLSFFKTAKSTAMDMH